VRRAVALVGLAVLAVAWPGEARAAGECDGLDVCISVPGPWVAVPPAPAAGTRMVYFQLTCPRRSVAGGLDAVLGDRSLEVRFLGRLGSPVNPGITTVRSVVFVATWARRRVTYFRPFLGCIPTAGGGGRETTSLTAVPRSAVPIRRVRTLRVRADAPARLTFGCRSGERLVGSTYAVAFRTAAAPSTEILSGVGASLRRRDGRVELRARRAAAVPARLPVAVQVHAICARGPP
jgi:hypothetical protein